MMELVYGEQGLFEMSIQWLLHPIFYVVVLEIGLLVAFGLYDGLDLENLEVKVLGKLSNKYKKPYLISMTFLTYILTLIIIITSIVYMQYKLLGVEGEGYYESEIEIMSISEVEGKPKVDNDLNKRRDMNLLTFKSGGKEYEVYIPQELKQKVEESIEEGYEEYLVTEEGAVFGDTEIEIAIQDVLEGKEKENIFKDYGLLINGEYYSIK